LKYLVYTAGYLTRKTDSLLAYNIVYSSLNCIHNFNQSSEDSIKKVISKGNSLIEGEEESSRQTYLAYLCSTMQIEFSVAYKESKEFVLSNPEKILPEERRWFFIEQLYKGEIERRGFIDLENVDLLISLFLEIETKYIDLFDNDIPMEKVKMMAGKALIAYSFPNEFIPGLSEKVLTRPGGLSEVLSLIKKFQLSLHKEIDPADIKIGELIAVGSAGKVFKGIYNGEEVAVKILSEDMLNFSVEEFKREVSIMSTMKHENLIQFYGAVTKEEKMMIVSKYIKGGNLHDLVSNLSIDLPLTTRIKIINEIAKGMAFLHAREIIHRDLKSLNVLLDDGYSVRIIDFGTSRIMDRDKLMTQAIGTVSYMSPEIFNNEKYTEKTDIYSFAMVFWEVMARKTPFSELNSWNIPVMVTKGERPLIPKDWSQSISKLIKSCWDQKPSKRPSFSEILFALSKIQSSISDGSILP